MCFVNHMCDIIKTKCIRDWQDILKFRDIESLDNYSKHYIQAKDTPSIAIESKGSNHLVNINMIKIKMHQIKDME